MAICRKVMNLSTLAELISISGFQFMAGKLYHICLSASSRALINAIGFRADKNFRKEVCKCGLIGVALLQMLGCRSSERIQFGIYAVPERELSSARSLGANFVVGPADKKYVEAARRAGLKVIADGNGAFKDDAIAGRYLTDEPDLRDIPVRQLELEYARARRQWSKPVFLNVSSGYSVEAYRKACDVIMFDWYPIGWQPIQTFYANARIARLAAHGKPFIATVQAFSWANYPQLMPPNSRYRKPTPTEVQAMAVWAAMNGASGIFFYPLDDGKSRLTDSPELMDAVRESIELVKKHERYFTGPRGYGPYPFSFRDQSQRYNAIAEASIAIRYSESTKDADTYYLVAANTTENEIAVNPGPGVEFLGATFPIVFKPLAVQFFSVRIPKLNR
jgi:hypothetical protein